MANPSWDKAEKKGRNGNFKQKFFLNAAEPYPNMILYWPPFSSKGCMTDLI
jgi:hypothetical protein